MSINALVLINFQGWLVVLYLLEASDCFSEQVMYAIIPRVNTAEEEFHYSAHRHVIKSTNTISLRRQQSETYHRYPPFTSRDDPGLFERVRPICSRS